MSFYRISKSQKGNTNSSTSGATASTRTKSHNANHRQGTSRKSVASKKWDDTVTDLTAHMLSPDEQTRRKEAHRSTNLDAVRQEMMERSLLKARANNSMDDCKKSAFLREILYDQTQLSDVITHTDRVMSVVKDLFADDPRRREAIPNVTLAPHQGITQNERLQGPVYERPHIQSQLAILSESVMDPCALNEVTSSSQDSVCEHQTLDDEDDDDEKENSTVHFRNKVYLDRFFKSLLTRQTIRSYRVEQLLPERGPRGEVLTDSTNTRKLNELSNAYSMQTPEAQDVSIEERMEDRSVLAINDTAKIKKKSQSRIENELLLKQETTQQDRNDLTKVMQGLQEDICTYEKLTGRSSSTLPSSSATSGYTGTLLQTIRKLVDYLGQSDRQLLEERQHRMKLDEQVQQQQYLIDALTADVMDVKERLIGVDLCPPKNQAVGPVASLRPREFATRSKTQDLQPPSDKMTVAPLVSQYQSSLNNNNPHHNNNNHDKSAPVHTDRAQSTKLLSYNINESTLSEWSSNLGIQALPGTTLRDLSYVGSLSHIQPASTALLLSPPRQKDRSMLPPQRRGFQQPLQNLPDERSDQPIVSRVKENAEDSKCLLVAFDPLYKDGQNSHHGIVRTAQSTIEPTDFTPRDGLLTNTTLPATTTNHAHASTAQKIIYDHGVYPILQTSLAPSTDVSHYQLDIARRRQKLSQEHAQAHIRLAQLQKGLTNDKSATGLVALNASGLVVSPSVSPIPFQVEGEQHTGAAGDSATQKITVSVPMVDELEISATSTPSPKCNLSELTRRQGGSGGNTVQQKQTVHQGSTPLTSSRKKGTDEGFFALTAHIAT